MEEEAETKIVDSRATKVYIVLFLYWWMYLLNFFFALYL